MSNSNDDFNFSGLGNSYGPRLEEPGWWVGIITEIQSRDREGKELKNRNEKPYVRVILQVVGGDHDGEGHVETVYKVAGWRMEQIAKAVGYDPTIDQDAKTGAFPPQELVEKPLVFHVQFQQGSDRLEAALPKNFPLPPFISIDEAKRAVEEGTIEVHNLEIMTEDPSTDSTYQF